MLHHQVTNVKNQPNQNQFIHFKKGCSKFCCILAGAPTLSMLLELPPSVPGTPLPELPAPVESAEMPVQEVKMESPLMRPSGSAALLQCNYFSAR